MVPSAAAFSMIAVGIDAAMLRLKLLGPGEAASAIIAIGRGCLYCDPILIRLDAFENISALSFVSASLRASP